MFLSFSQRTKIWGKYSKDIETYVDKRAHLGEENSIIHQTYWYLWGVENRGDFNQIDKKVSIQFGPVYCYLVHMADLLRFLIGHMSLNVVIYLCCLMFLLQNWSTLPNFQN